MPRTPYADAVKRVLNTLGEEGVSISDVARTAKVNWKTAKKALDLLSTVADTLDGRIIRMKKIGTTKVFQIECAGPTVSHANEVDFTTLYKMWEDLAKAVYHLTSEATEENDGLTAKQREGLAIVGKVGIQLGTLLGIDRLLTPVDILEFRRICTVIGKVLDEPETSEGSERLLSNLEGYFDTGAEWEEKWAKELAKRIKTEWFHEYNQKEEKNVHTADTFLNQLSTWLSDQVNSHEEEQRDKSSDC